MADQETNIQPLAEKLESGEQLTFADFEAVLAAYRDAMADGRINLREALRIFLAVSKILGEFIDKTPEGNANFGFGNNP